MCNGTSGDIKTYHSELAEVVKVFTDRQCVLLEEGDALADGRQVVVDFPLFLASLQ